VLRTQRFDNTGRHSLAPAHIRRDTLCHRSVALGALRASRAIARAPASASRYPSAVVHPTAVLLRSYCLMSPLNVYVCACTILFSLNEHQSRYGHSMIGFAAATSIAPHVRRYRRSPIRTHTRDATASAILKCNGLDRFPDRRTLRLLTRCIAESNPALYSDLTRALRLRLVQSPASLLGGSK
jgi:hypothetical protein